MHWVKRMLQKNCLIKCKLLCQAQGNQFSTKCYCWLARIALIPLSLIFAAGCDGAKESNLIAVHGRVTNAGEPLHVDGYDVGIGAVRVAFYPIPDGETASSEVIDTAADEEGFFKVRDGLPAGEYCVVIEQWDPHPVVDRLQGKFNRLNSRILRTVSHKEDYLEIDLANEASVTD